MSSDKIKKLEQQIEQAKARLQQAKARERNKERKLDTRRKILLGSLLISMRQKGLIREDALRQQLDEFLTADRDRVLFGLPLKSAIDQELGELLEEEFERVMSGSTQELG